ncbi:hypothetical protein MOQ_001062 [Trypanosoma cruzi marinkellei]|uniref:Uncharacterized protein n=1 Tax=Trypanosoma cruzi marinkellei TaxID=85056 RepID=K2NUR8_TRYCR|nr:hypothetical protein MOQ_001062 [Trypanosoma cruzi marinkellei]
MRFCGSIRGMGIVAFAFRRRRPIVCCCRMHATEGKNALSSLHLAEEKAQLFSRLSEALFADEAAALSLRLPDTGECDVSGAVNEVEAPETSSSAEYCMEVALSPPPLLSSSSKGNEGHNKDGTRTNTAMCDSLSPTASFSCAMDELSMCLHRSDFSTALASAVRAFMSSDTSVMNRAASELILAGSDVKALFTDGTLRGVRMEHKCMSQCDFSTLSFLSVVATDVDFSRSLFYGVIFHDCVFVRCCFDGCVLKEISCSGNVRFEECSFRFASIGLRLPRGEKKAHVRVLFDRGDFDLADFDGSERLPANCFTNCYNTDLSAKFPLKAHGAMP